MFLLFGSGEHAETAGVANLWAHGGLFPTGVLGVVVALQMVDHHLGKVRPIGRHRAVCHQAPEAVGVENRAHDVLAEDSERSHRLRGGSAKLVHLRRVQGADANAMPINEQRVAVERGGLALDECRLPRLARLRRRRQDQNRCRYQDRPAHNGLHRSGIPANIVPIAAPGKPHTHLFEQAA